MNRIEPWPQSEQARCKQPAKQSTESPRISVVVPSFNQADYLMQCLASIVGQDYPNREIIVMDGGSRDHSVNVIESFAAHLHYWQSAPDGGQGAAINAGLAHASGDVFCWINSDDLLMPGALTRVAEVFRQQAADVVYGDALNLFEASGELQYWQAHWLTNAFLDIGGLISSHAMFWHRRIHQPIWEELKCNVDGELWQRLIPGARCHYLPLPLGIYRAHEQTKSAAERWAQAWAEDDQKIWARHGKPRRGRIKMQFFAKSQRLFKWWHWHHRAAERRAMIAALGWTERIWRGPVP